MLPVSKLINSLCSSLSCLGLKGVINITNLTSVLSQLWHNVVGKGQESDPTNVSANTLVDTPLTCRPTYYQCFNFFLTARPGAKRGSSFTRGLYFFRFVSD